MPKLLYNTPASSPDTPLIAHRCVECCFYSAFVKYEY